ncbi:MAG: hypothetical protein QOH39_123 [Verrucomicrobiota bacterium]|jgi:type II secretory pathway pseudopilin PulG
MIVNRRFASGFTILELLVAAAISVVVVVMLGTMFGSLTNMTSHANERIDAFRDARAAIHLIERDFRSLVKAQPAPYFEIDSDLAGPDVRQVYGLISAKNQPTGIPSAAAGDLCAVRYYSAWDGHGYVLHRYFRNSDLTLTSFKKYLQTNGTIGYPTKTEDFVGELYYQGNSVNEPIATYAWDLRVTAYDGSGNVINKTPDVDGHDTTFAPYICDPSGTTNPLPAAIEISFKAMSPNAARTVIAVTAANPNAFDVWKVPDTATPTANNKQLYDRLIAPYAYDFRTRIDLQ